MSTYLLDFTLRHIDTKGGVIGGDELTVLESTINKTISQKLDALKSDYGSQQTIGIFSMTQKPEFRWEQSSINKTKYMIATENIDAMFLVRELKAICDVVIKEVGTHKSSSCFCECQLAEILYYNKTNN